MVCAVRFGKLGDASQQVPCAAWWLELRDTDLPIRLRKPHCLDIAMTALPTPNPHIGKAECSAN